MTRGMPIRFDRVSMVGKDLGQLSGAPTKHGSCGVLVWLGPIAKFQFRKERSSLFFCARDAPSQRWPWGRGHRPSRRLNGNEYHGMTATPSFLLFGKKKDIVALITAPRWESGVPTNEEKSRQISMSINLTFLKNKSKSWQPLTFSSVFIMKSRRSIWSGTTAMKSLLITRTSTGTPTPYKGKVS